jgi:DNA-binding transcriptional ArsR family regulator
MSLAIYYTLWCSKCVNQLSDALVAISHPTRRAIIEQLTKGPARFLDIANRFDTALNAVTKHLKILERAGLIERNKKGREVLISLKGEPLAKVAVWIHTHERFWNNRLDTFEQHFKNSTENE